MATAMYPKLAVDGIFGSVTIKALQMYLKHKAGTYRHTTDGQFGYYTALALQYWLSNMGYYHYAIDGNAGKYTWMALREYLKFANGAIRSQPDWPDIGTATCRDLQEFLNARRFY